MHRLPLILNALGFQFVWLSCVLGAARGLDWAGPAALALYAAAHASRSDVDLDEAALAALAVLLGLLIDSTYLQLGLLSFASPGPLPGLAPVWILALWAGFALTLRHSLAWFASRPAIAAAFGAVGGPLAYLAGERLGGLVFTGSPWPALLAVGVAWALVTPLLLSVAVRRTAPLAPQRMEDPA